MDKLFLKKRLLLFIVAYNAEKTIKEVLFRIPETLNQNYYTEVLIIDDSSDDATVKKCLELQQENKFPFKLTVLVNPENLGYGGNQKVGYQYAIENNFDVVALIHGDGQYAPERLPYLLKPLFREKIDAVFGSRMLNRFSAIKGGMPLYKYIGNKILTKYQNWILKSNLSEFHSGYRVYKVNALKNIPFHLNTNDFHFDTEIIIQLLFAGNTIKEISIPTYYGDEICYVNGIKYAYNVFVSMIKAVMQKYGVFYEKKFDCNYRGSSNLQYKSKMNFNSPQSTAFDYIKSGTKVLDVGCGAGHLPAKLKNKNCKVTGIDMYKPKKILYMDQFYRCDLNKEVIPVNISNFDYILLLDVIEHLHNPEIFIENLYEACKNSPHVKILASTGNIGFLPLRLMLMFGQFNYGKRGILDLTHSRLFTFKTFKKLFEQFGFEVLKVKGVPAPIPFVIKRKKIYNFLMCINEFFIQIYRNIFSYQMFFIIKPKRSLELLLSDANEEIAKIKKAA
jgi:glycosyltransferase involved in cell wall biosynthesis